MWPFKSKKVTKKQTIALSDGELMAQALLESDVALTIYCDSVENGQAIVRCGLTVAGKPIDATALLQRTTFLYAGDTLNITGPSIRINAI